MGRGDEPLPKSWVLMVMSFEAFVQVLFGTSRRASDPWTDDVACGQKYAVQCWASWKFRVTLNHFLELLLRGTLIPTPPSFANLFDSLSIKT